MVRASDMFVTVDEVASAQIQEMEAIYPVLNSGKSEETRMKVSGCLSRMCLRKRSYRLCI